MCVTRYLTGAQWTGEFFESECRYPGAFVRLRARMHLRGDVMAITGVSKQWPIQAGYFGCQVPICDDMNANPWEANKKAARKRPGRKQVLGRCS